MTVQGPPYICTTMFGQHVPSACLSQVFFDNVYFQGSGRGFSNIQPTDNDVAFSPVGFSSSITTIDCCVFILTMYVQVAAAEVADQREDFNLAKHQDRLVGFLQVFYV